MRKTIKITEEQKCRLMEMLFPDGSDAADTIPQYHGSRVVAAGYEDGEDGGANPPTGTEISNTMCKNYPFGIGYYKGAVARPLGWQ